MADTKLTELDALSSVQSTDLLYVVSLQTLPSGESKKITVNDFLGNLSDSIETSSTITAASILANTVAGTNVNAVAFTSNTINTSYINATSGNFDSITSGFFPLTAVTSITADNTYDNSRVYNLNTNSTNLSVILPSELSNGFNMGITNIGTGTIYISSTQVPMICAFSNRCSTQFGSLFIYKSNNILFGIGGFDL
jgi:hypothetical protein